MQHQDIAYAIVYFVNHEGEAVRVNVRYPAFWSFYHLENRMKQCCDVAKVSEINETLDDDWVRDFT